MGSSGSFDSISDPYIKRVKFEGGGGGWGRMLLKLLYGERLKLLNLLGVSYTKSLKNGSKGGRASLRLPTVKYLSSPTLASEEVTRIK